HAMTAFLAFPVAYLSAATADNLAGMPASPYVTAMRAHVGNDLLLLPGPSAVVRGEGGRILLMRRGDDGRWSLPAGMIEPGEQPSDAALREVFEETGIIAEIER